MPRDFPDAFASFEAVALRVALGHVPETMIQAHLSAHVLASDGPDDAEKVRPLALGNFHTRQASKAI